MSLTTADYEILRDPLVTMTQWGKVQNYEDEQLIPFDPYKIMPALHIPMLQWLANPPKNKDGHNKRLMVVTCRQSGKSTVAAMAIANLAMYTPGAFAAIIADQRERAQMLFDRVMLYYNNLPEHIRSPKIPNRESRQLTLGNLAKVRTLSAQQDNMGIGAGAGFLHMSEVPFWPDPGDVWFKLSPAFNFRKEAVIIMESTPAPLDEPGAEWFQSMCDEALAGDNPDATMLFVPYFLNFACERSWEPGWTLTDKEWQLLNKFGPPTGMEPLSNPRAPYLTLENLAFRRFKIRDDKKIAKNPDLFFTFYPTDPITCWQQIGSGAFPDTMLQKHIEGDLQPWNGPYMEYEQPRPGAVYVIGVDPSGFGTGDEAAFHILEVWMDEWRQVATFASNDAPPDEVARRVMTAAKKYNDAIVVVENNGNAAGTLALLDLAHENKSGITLPNEAGVEQRYKLKNLYYHKNAKGPGANPGIPASEKSIAEAMALLVEGLMDKLVIHDQQTVVQLRSYRRDKEVEDAERFKILNPDKQGRGRKSKHHWDRVSSLMWACMAVPMAPARFRPRTMEETVEKDRAFEELMAKPFDEWTAHEQQRYQEAIVRPPTKKKRRQGERVKLAPLKRTKRR